MSFINWDIYYLFEYADSFRMHGDGEPFLIEYKDNKAHFCYVVMKSDISDSPKFQGKLEKGKYFDLETPYGYGGPLSDCEVPNDSQKNFLSELSDYCKEQRIVSQFFRFHPILSNQNLLSEVVETVYLKDSIYIDTNSIELIWNNLESKNRNMVRKAIKCGVVVRRASVDQYESFLKMYNETMDKDHADEYYYFNKEYFEAQQTLKDNACIFYALFENKPIAGALFYYNDKYIHYHLAGTHTEYRRYSPNNLLLYEVACWASKQGIKQFHLGGGIAAEDNLFKFKKQFNKNGRIQFYIGRTIFDKELYKKLIKMRKELNPEFDINNNRMIQYRY